MRFTSGSRAKCGQPQKEPFSIAFTALFKSSTHDSKTYSPRLIASMLGSVPGSMGQKSIDSFTLAV